MVSPLWYLRTFAIYSLNRPLTLCHYSLFWPLNFPLWYPNQLPVIHKFIQTIFIQILPLPFVFFVFPLPLFYVTRHSTHILQIYKSIHQISIMAFLSFLHWKILKPTSPLHPYTRGPSPYIHTYTTLKPLTRFSNKRKKRPSLRHPALSSFCCVWNGTGIFLFGRRRASVCLISDDADDLGMRSWA